MLVKQVPFIGMYRREECLDLLKTSTDEFDYRGRPKIQRYEVCLHLSNRIVIAVTCIADGFMY